MEIVKIHEEAIKFLREAGRVFDIEEGGHGFYLGSTLYLSTDKKNTYIIQYENITENE